MSTELQLKFGGELSNVLLLRYTTGLCMKSFSNWYQRWGWNYKLHCPSTQICIYHHPGVVLVFHSGSWRYVPFAWSSLYLFFSQEYHITEPLGLALAKQTFRESSAVSPPSRMMEPHLTLSVLHVGLCFRMIHSEELVHKIKKIWIQYMLHLSIFSYHTLV